MIIEMSYFLHNDYLILFHYYKEELLMARFEEAENRMFNIKICLKCNAQRFKIQS